MPSANSGIASLNVNRSSVQPSYPTITLLRLTPSLARPMKTFPQSSGTPTMMPVWRTNQESVLPSYMIPACQVNGRFVLKRPPNIRRVSRTLTPGSMLVICARLSSSWAYDEKSTSSPAPICNVVNPRSNSGRLRRFVRTGSSPASPPISICSVVSRDVGVGRCASDTPGRHSPSTSAHHVRRDRITERITPNLPSMTVRSVLVEVTLDRRGILRLEQSQAKQHARLLRIVT